MHISVCGKATSEKKIAGIQLMHLRTLQDYDRAIWQVEMDVAVNLYGMAHGFRIATDACAGQEA